MKGELIDVPHFLSDIFSGQKLAFSRCTLHFCLTHVRKENPLIFLLPFAPFVRPSLVRASERTMLLAKDPDDGGQHYAPLEHFWTHSYDLFFRGWEREGGRKRDPEPDTLVPHPQRQLKIV